MIYCAIRIETYLPPSNLTIIYSPDNYLITDNLLSVTHVLECNVFPILTS